MSARERGISFTVGVGGESEAERAKIEAIKEELRKLPTVQPEEGISPTVAAMKEVKMMLEQGDEPEVERGWNQAQREEQEKSYKPPVLKEVEVQPEWFNPIWFKRSLVYFFERPVASLTENVGDLHGPKPDEYQIGNVLKAIGNTASHLEIQREKTKAGAEEMVSEFVVVEKEIGGVRRKIRTGFVNDVSRKIEFKDIHEIKLKTLGAGAEWAGSLAAWMGAVYSRWASNGSSVERWAGELISNYKRVPTLGELGAIREIGKIRETEQPVEEYWDRMQRAIIAIALVSQEKTKGFLPSGLEPDDDAKLDLISLAQEALIRDKLTVKRATSKRDKTGAITKYEIQEKVLNTLAMRQELADVQKVEKFVKACALVNALGRLEGKSISDPEYQAVRGEVGVVMDRLENLEKNGEVSFGLNFAWRAALAELHFTSIDARFGWAVKHVKTYEGKKGWVENVEDKVEMEGFPASSDAVWVFWPNYRVWSDFDSHWQIGSEAIVFKKDVKQPYASPENVPMTVVPNGMIKDFYQHVKVIRPGSIPQNAPQLVKDVMQQQGGDGEEVDFWKLWWREKVPHYKLPWTKGTDRAPILRAARTNEVIKRLVGDYMAGEILKLMKNYEAKDYQALLQPEKLKELRKKADLSFGIGSDEAQRIVAGVLAAQVLLFKNRTGQIFAGRDKSDAEASAAYAEMVEAIKKSRVMDEKGLVLFQNFVTSGKISWK